MTPNNGDPTVSGLHEHEIDPADLARLQAAFVCRSVDPAGDPPDGWAGPELDSGQIHTAGLDIGTPRALKLRIAPLPRRARVRPLKQQPPDVTIRRGLARMLEQPIRRRRTPLGELSPAQQKALFRRLYEKYGELANGLHVQALFAHIPPEAAHSIELANDLRSLQFALPPDVSPRGVREGFYLVILSAAAGETRNLLLRL